MATPGCPEPEYQCEEIRVAVVTTAPLGVAKSWENCWNGAAALGGADGALSTSLGLDSHQDSVGHSTGSSLRVTRPKCLVIVMIVRQDSQTVVRPPGPEAPPQGSTLGWFSIIPRSCQGLMPKNWRSVQPLKSTGTALCR